MTTLATADLHLSANPRDAYRFVFLEETLPALVHEHGARRVLVLGDLTEVKDAHRAPFVNRVVDGLAALAEEADVYLLRGNHDYVVEEAPFYRFLSHIPRLHWINEPTPLRLRGLGTCLFLPATSNYEQDWSGVDMRADWFFCHETFTGAVAENGQHLEGVPRSVFPKGARVVSGDVHVPQKWYVGAPHLIDFGDDFSPRVLLLEGTRQTSVPVTGPQKRLVRLTSLDHLDRDQGVRPGDVVKVKVELGGGDLIALGRQHIRRLVHDWAEEAGVVLYELQLVVPEGERAAERRRSEHAPQSDDALMRAYVRAQGADKVTLSAGQKIREKAG